MAQKIGRVLKGGEVIELLSDIGGGKTTFVRGLARGLGSKDHVASPTFTLAREYKSSKHTLYHFDFYRLSEPGIMEQEIAELLTSPKSIVVVEWGKIVEHVLPAERVRVQFKPSSDDSRQIDITCPERFSYILERVK